MFEKEESLFVFSSFVLLFAFGFKRIFGFALLYEFCKCLMYWKRTETDITDLKFLGKIEIFPNLFADFFCIICIHLKGLLPVRFRQATDLPAMEKKIVLISVETNIFHCVFIMLFLI